MVTRPETLDLTAEKLLLAEAVAHVSSASRLFSTLAKHQRRKVYQDLNRYFAFGEEQTLKHYLSLPKDLKKPKRAPRTEFPAVTRRLRKETIDP